jgi:hypothetical protein
MKVYLVCGTSARIVDTLTVIGICDSRFEAEEVYAEDYYKNHTDDDDYDPDSDIYEIEMNMLLDYGLREELASQFVDRHYT